MWLFNHCIFFFFFHDLWRFFFFVVLLHSVPNLLIYVVTVRITHSKLELNSSNKICISSHSKYFHIIMILENDWKIGFDFVHSITKMNVCKMIKNQSLVLLLFKLNIQVKNWAGVTDLLYTYYKIYIFFIIASVRIYQKFSFPLSLFLNDHLLLLKLILYR